MDYELLVEKAKEAAQKAYCPYSNFAVGACVLGESGKYYCGCNVENGSFGLTICAERNAIFHAVAEGERKIQAVAVFAMKANNCTPCGACRQVLSEFAINDEMDVITCAENGCTVYKLSDLLPVKFSL